ncbi:substrate-binding periplasmic protein [Pseudomonas akapageensis]|uniref:substrate-binding periplasmic protein n=1 Tax=Pseudomonas akapageensis TaxID=2609961 RepID=UPI00140E3A01|nr:transporter substrate-binding domain-containing protein [Pseudomonas akapageensis]
MIAGFSDNAALNRAFLSDTWRFRLGDTHRRPRLFPSVLLSWLLLGALPAVQAETLKLATGEFQPYVSESLPGQGLSSQIVRSAFEAAGYQTTLMFMPWRRAAAQTRAGHYAASYPWAMNEERKQHFLYSHPIYQGQIRFFALLDSPMADTRQWYGKTLCIPDGWDTTQLLQPIEHYGFKLERPSDIENCLLMVGSGRVELTAINPMVAGSLNRRLHLEHKVVPVGEVIATDLNYLIVPRVLPDAVQLIDDFNRGLEHIHENGRYREIIENAAGTP